MMLNQAALEYWNAFLDTDPQVPKETPYQVWYFGNTLEMSLELAQLVISGKKIATAGLAAVNQMRPDSAPVPNGYSVVTDFHGVPMCVIQTAKIKHLPFNQIDGQFAFDEGEGDQSLEYWRRVHRSYFAREAADLGLDFDEQTLICCERFRLLYPR